MDRVAVFVDAGYLLAQGSRELCGEKLERKHISLNDRALIDSIRGFAEKISGLPLLRIYWYDGTSQAPTLQHNTLADLPGVKVRLGFVNSAGRQKGVDSLAVTDMITLARNRAMADCVLLSGDEDLRVGVQQAQEYGARVHLLGIAPVRANQSRFLRQEVDSSHEWNADDLQAFMECAEDRPSPPPEGDRSLGPTTLQEVARLVADDVPLSEVPALVEEIRSIDQRPPHIDGRLLALSRKALGGDLDSGQKRDVRTALLDALEERLAARSDAGQ